MKFKKILLMSLTMLVLWQIWALADEAASEITLNCNISSEHNPDDIRLIYDGKGSTAWSAADGTVISVESSEPIGSLYIEWNTPPDNWAAAAPDGQSRTSSSGFLHDYAEFDDNIMSLNIYIYGKNAELSELYIYGKGETPATVQKWDRPLDKADMLLVSTHADDEHLFFGGTMPLYAGELGKKVQVAYLTRHEVNRTHELLNGLWTVGIRNYPLISDFADQYADSLDAAKNLYDENEILDFQVMLLRRFKPDVVIGHDLNGEYGHGVHMLNAETLCRALDISGDPSQFPETAESYGTWEVQKCYLHLYAEGEIIMDWSIPLESFGGRTAFEMAEAGFSCHKSQQEFFQVSDSLGYMGCRRFGLYKTTVGPDTGKGDFFENVVQTLLPDPEPEPAPNPVDSDDAGKDVQPDNSEKNTVHADSPSASDIDKAATYAVYVFMAAGALLCVILTVRLLIKKI